MTLGTIISVSSLVGLCCLFVWVIGKQRVEIEQLVAVADKKNKRIDGLLGQVEKSQESVARVGELAARLLEATPPPEWAAEVPIIAEDPMPLLGQELAKEIETIRAIKFRSKDGGSD